MPFYHSPNTICAQIQARGISLNINNTIYGWAPKNWRDRSSRWPGIRVNVWTHTGCCDRRWVFGVDVNRRHFGYLTKGDAEPGNYNYTTGGWHFGRVNVEA